MDLLPVSLFHFTFWLAFGDRMIMMLVSPVRGLWFDVGFYWPDDGCNRLDVALISSNTAWLPGDEDHMR